MTPKHLWQCQNLDEQVAWCEARLLAGATLSDPGIWLGGADPDTVIRQLRKKHDIQTVRCERKDAAGTTHKVTGWKLRNHEAGLQTT
ncbi:MAG: hypothetical protein E6R03_06510 [Hyphomicrobiaceae bacterium]|nr:MAG: hypothetical protein E6R03_06510 [Hyphomicrobiaceae bacterium]